MIPSRAQISARELHQAPHARRVKVRSNLLWQTPRAASSHTIPFGANSASDTRALPAYKTTSSKAFPVPSPAPLEHS